MVTKLRNDPSPLPADAAERLGTVRLGTVRLGTGQTAAAPTGRTMVPEFRLLGLQPREARVDIIRQALHNTASRVQPADADEQLVRIAIAGYHLLDPRRRRSLYERVQLLLWTEEEWDALPTHSNSGTWPIPPRIVATPIRPPEPPATSEPSATPVASNQPENSSLVSSAEEERQVALELFRNLRTRDRQATVLWIGVMAIMLSLITALGLFALIAPRL